MSSTLLRGRNNLARILVLAGVTSGGACSVITGLDQFQLVDDAGPGAAGGGGATSSSVSGGTGGSGGSVGTGGEGGTGGGAMSCTPGEVEACYSGPDGTEGVGACKAGERTCTAEGTWGPCEGEVVPTGQEIVGNAIDDNCDGTALAGPGPVVRYLINEAESGMGIAALEDVSPDPLNLVMTYADGTPTFTADSLGHRGIYWSVKESGGRASIDIEQSKVKTALDGKTAATLEIVVDITDKNNWARLVHIGYSTGTGGVDFLSLLFDDNASACIHLNNARAACWPQAQIVNAGRTVIHAVLDTSLPDGNDRSKLYRNGALIPGGVFFPIQNAIIDLSQSTHLVLGNAPTGVRSPMGTIYYAAIYAAALTEAEIQTNAALLLINDDQP